MKLNNNNFKLYIVHYKNYNDKIYIPFSFYENGSQNIFGSNNEKLTESENSQTSLTFSVPLIVDGTRNIFIDYLVIDREIRLEFSDGDVIDFFITDIKPSFSSENTIYSYTCQDSFSYVLSKQNNISVSTEDASIWEDGLGGPRSIEELGRKVLDLSMTSWTLDPFLNSLTIHFPDNLSINSSEMKVSLDLNNTTPYNALVEIAKLFNALIELDYKNKIVYFKNIETIRKKYLNLKPEIDISAFSYGEQGSNLFNIMHVSGGEDAYGNYIGILPSMPRSLSTIFMETDISHELQIDSFIDPYKLPSFWWNNGFLYKRTFETPFYEEITQKITPINWKECSTINELKDTCLDFYNEMEVDNRLGVEKTSSERDAIEDYFNRLKNIPHAASFLYDFSYWKNNNLLSEERYLSLTTDLNTTFRNINISTIAHNTIFNMLNYELQKIEDQEEEIIYSIATEEENRATLKTETEIEQEIYYIGHSIAIEETNNEITDIKYYLPIGVAEKNVIYYGSGEGLQETCYSLPDLDKWTIDSLTLYTIDSFKEEVKETITVTNSNIDLTNNCFYIDESYSDKTLVYINFEDIKTYTPSADSTNTIDSLIDFEIYNLQTKLNNLHTKTYYYLNEVLYGKFWLNKKINNIKYKIAEYTKQKNEILNELISKFGNNWNTYTIESFKNSYELGSEFSYLKTQLDNVQMQIGGIGNREKETSSTNKEYYSYRGVLNYSLLNYEAMLKNYSSEHAPSLGLVDKLELLKKEQSDWYNNFYKNYGDVIRETHYEDSAQITGNGLYASAMKQFLTYKEPTKTYTNSMITTDDILSVHDEIKIGDVISITHKDLNLKPVDKTYELFLSNALSHADIVYVKKDGQNFYMPCKVILNEYNFLKFYCDEDLSNTVIESIVINDTVYDWKGKNRIVSFQQSKHFAPINLRITGVSKDLRSKIAQLTVKENTLYNTLIDRLVSILS